MKIKIKCGNCGAEYEYRDEDEQSNVTGYIQKKCPNCGSDAIAD